MPSAFSGTFPQRWRGSWYRSGIRRCDDRRWSGRRSSYSSAASTPISNPVAVAHRPPLLHAVCHWSIVAAAAIVAKFVARREIPARTVLSCAISLVVHPPPFTVVWIFGLGARLFGVVAEALTFLVLAGGLILWIWIPSIGRRRRALPRVTPMIKDVGIVQPPSASTSRRHFSALVDVVW